MRNRYTVIALNKKTGQELFRFKTIAGASEDEKKAILDMLNEILEAEVTVISVDEHEPTYERRMADIDKIVNNAVNRIIKAIEKKDKNECNTR